MNSTSIKTNTKIVYKPNTLFSQFYSINKNSKKIQLSTTNTSIHSKIHHVIYNEVKQNYIDIICTIKLINKKMFDDEYFAIALGYDLSEEKSNKIFDCIINYEFNEDTIYDFISHYLNEFDIANNDDKICGFAFEFEEPKYRDCVLYKIIIDNDCDDKKIKIHGKCGFYSI